MFTNRIETFDTLQEAEIFISMIAEQAERHLDYIKFELTLIDNRRWRVGISTAQQIDIFDGFLE